MSWRHIKQISHFGQIVFTSSDRTRQQTALCEHLESKENHGQSAGQGQGSSERQVVILRTEIKGEPKKGDIGAKS